MLSWLETRLENGFVMYKSNFATQKDNFVTNTNNFDVDEKNIVMAVVGHGKF